MGHSPGFTGGGDFDPQGMPWDDGSDIADQTEQEVPKAEKIVCPYCDKGILHLVRLPHDGYNAGYTEHYCPICDGTGEILSNLKFDICSECEGFGVYQPNRGESDPDPFHCERCLGIGLIRAYAQQDPTATFNPYALIGLLLFVSTVIVWLTGSLFGWW